MANEKRLIDANALREQMFSYYGCVNEYSSKEHYRGETLMNYEVAGLIEDCIDNAPTVDAVELPKGKPGDFLEWDNGTGFKQIYCICAVMICEDCVRYDLEKFAPEVNHKNIVRIMSKEQAVKEYRDRCARERTEEEPTFTACGADMRERRDND